MTATNFGKCLSHVLKHEGGFVNHPKDPGGATNLGITKRTLERHLNRTVTVKEVRNLAPETAAMIYKRSYWNPIGADDMPDGVDLVTFDAAVNSGNRQGVKWTQRAVGVADDGKVGPVTLSAISRADAVSVIKSACAKRLGFMQRIRHRKTGARLWDTFGRGWGRRVAEVEAEALAMATRSSVAVAVEADKAKSAEKSAYVAGGASVAAGGGGSELAGLPADFMLFVYIAVGVIAVLAILRGLHQRDRAAALTARAQGSPTK